jgi:Outer membrane receptor proteins, mostly Fe transport
VGLQRNQVTSDASFPSIISSVLNNAVCGGYDAATNTCTYQDGPGLNLLDPVPASVVSAATYLRSTHAISQNTTFDAQINGPLGFSLPGGAVQFSAYTSYTKEWYSDINDPITASGQGVDGAVSAQGKRGHVAGALEFSLPVVKMLTLSVAGRYDKYLNTGVGGLITGQGGLEFRPVRSLLIRGSIGNQFRAPDMQRVFGGATKAFESAIDSVACKNAGGTVGQTGGPAVCNNPVQAIPVSSAGNPDLKAEKGTTYSFGFVYEPIDRLTLTSDYYYISLRGGVQAPDAQFILNSCANQGSLCNLIHRDSNGNLGPTSLIVEDPINTSSQSQKGLDNTVSYDFGISPIGRFRIKYSLTWLFSYKYQINDQSPNTQQLGYTSVPRYRWTLRGDWSRGPFGINTTWNYIPHIPGANTDDPALYNQYLAAFSTVNMQGYVHLTHSTTLRVGVNNILDAHPPYDPTDDNNQFTGGVALAYSNPFGRMGYVQFEWDFK